MYNLPYHKEKNERVVKEFIGKYPFAFLTGVDIENKPVATQLPLFLEEKPARRSDGLVVAGGEGRKIVRGHIMKNTDHHRAFMHNHNVLVVFSGHHSYVSGTWYSNPHTPSTWNYMSVHAKGVIRFLDDDALIDALRAISLHFEGHDQNSPTIYDNLPADYVKKIIKMIVAFEIEVKEIDTVFKLSQDRDAQSYANIIERLKQQGESGQVIAAEMEKRTGEVFHGNS